MSDETGQAGFARDKRLVNMQDSAVVDYLPDEYPRLRDYLFALIADPDTRVYAVMDGAFFQNIAAKLRDAGLARRSLYRYGGDYSVVMGGPWLIDPYQQENSGNLSIETGNVSNEQRITEITSRFEAILQLAADTSGLVFWVGDASLTEAALYDHLRRLNQIEVPKSSSESNESANSGGYELVTFRHADANVMAQVLPSLEASQLSRLFGSCRQIFFKPEPDWSKSAMRMVRPDDLPEPPGGPLRWTPQTICAIEGMRFNWLTTRTMKYLHKVADQRVRGISDEMLRADVHKWLKAAAAHGVNQESAFRRWAYLQVVTGGRLEVAPGLSDFMISAELTSDPNERVRILMRETIKYLKGV
ncbi:DUF4123 domain-containing protein [Advenella kashmirensis]